MFSKSLAGYKDKVSIKNFRSQGPNFCGPIGYQLMESKGGRTVAPLDYFSLAKDPASDNDRFVVTFGTEDTDLRGSHEFQIQAQLETSDYSHIKNTDAKKISVTYFANVTPLQIPDQEYTLNG